MRRTPLLLLIALGCPVVGIGIWLASQSKAEPARPRPVETANANTVPLTRILMFNTGVGHFEREGVIEGNPRVDLSFPLTDVNDLLKSLTVDDGGKPGIVSYDGNDPADNLSAFAMNLSSNPTFGQLLNQARGEKVEVTLEGGAVGNGPFTGTIVGMEATQENPAKEVQHLNLLTADGVRRLPLERIARFRFLNAAFEDEFRRGLAGLTSAQNAQRRSLSLHLRGEGKRKLKIGYVVDNPIWKSSYRLALEGKDGKPQLQGWAIVQNTTEEDWKDVRVVLVSGRPISFTMDLAQTLFMPRPPVTPEVYTSLQPPTHAPAVMPGGSFGGGGFGGGGLQGGGLQGGFQAGFGGPRRPTPPTDFDDKGRPIGGDPGNLSFFNRYQIDLGTSRSAPARLSYDELLRRRNAAVSDARATAAKIPLDPTLESIAVNAGSIGEGFRLIVDQPVSLPRQKSALLPVQHGPIALTPLSIYNRATHPRFPLRGAKIKNTTGQHLLAGPATVTDAEGYVGDCKLPNLQPNEERYVSFAMDLGLEITPDKRTSASEYGPFRIEKGIMIRLCTTTVQTKYRLNNRSSKPRTLLLDHTPERMYDIVGKNKPFETAKGVQRYEWKIAANTVVEEVITEQSKGDEITRLTNMGPRYIGEIIEDAVTSKPVKDALLKMLASIARVSAASNEASKVQTRIKAILAEQERIGTSINRLPKGSAAHKRLLEKFDVLEVELEKARESAKAKTEALEVIEKEHELFLSKLEAK